ncbi:MAG: sensor histidine kinase, partial [Spirochaetes bacterium]|nr:sensor histidine kinase [Spirochaetota bacterium]
NFTKIKISDYLVELVNNVFTLSQKKVSLKTDLDEITIDTSSAVSLGLIFNELATNTLKYGLVKTGENLCHISIKRDLDKKSYQFIYESNGIPFPANINLDHSDTMGLRLITSIVDQLEGTIELIRRPHPRFVIQIPAQ